MNNKRCVEALCLEVFSTIIRSVCHELKNNLAIINESGGLLDDLAVMHGDEGGVPGKRVKKSAATIADQVAAADKVIKNVSLFAHSHDFSISSVALKQALSLAVSLGGRKARGKSLDVSVGCDDNVEFRTYLMVFEVFIYKLLDHIYDTSAEGESVRVEAAEAGRQIEIRIYTEADLHFLIPEYKVGPDLLMSKLLNADLSLHTSHLLVTMPVNIVNTAEVITNEIPG